VPLRALADAVLAATAGRGADVVVVCIGGDALVDAVRCGARGARHVLVGTPAGTMTTLPLPLLLLREHVLAGFNLFLAPPERQRQATARALDLLARNVVAAPRPVPVPLADVARGYKRAAGRALLVP
jgi:NADPH2:quinone reductase